MSNSIYQMFNKPNNNSPFSVVQQFMQFKRSFTGNSKEEVERMLQSGKISQKQLNDAQAFAQQFAHMMGMK